MKIQISLDSSFSDSRLSSSGPEVQQDLKRQMNLALRIVFKVFHRLS